MIFTRDGFWVSKDWVKEIYIYSNLLASDDSLTPVSYQAVGRTEKGKEIILYSHEDKEAVVSWVNQNFGGGE